MTLRRTTMWLALLLVACATSRSAAQFGQSPGDGLAPVRSEMNRLADPTKSSDDEALEGFGRAIDGPDPVKGLAIQALGARLAIGMTRPPGAPSPAQTDFRRFLPFRGRLIEAIESADPNVRAWAVNTLFSLEMLAGLASGVFPTDEVTERFAAKYRGEPEPIVRAAIVRSLTFARSPQGRPATATIDRLFVTALDDPNASVLAIAVRGIGLRRVPQGLPRIVELLSDARRDVRSSAATAVQQFGPALGPYREQIQEARRVETDPSVRGVLDATLAAAGRGSVGR